VQGRVGGGAGEGRRGPNARIIAATQPTPVGAPIRLTRNTSASLSTLRIAPTRVGRRYSTGSAVNTRIQPGSGRDGPRAVPSRWWQTGQAREEVVQRLSDGPFLAGNPLTADSRHLRLGRMLDWLASQPGQTWQERWQASGAEQAGRQWPQLPAAWLRDTGHLQVKDPALSSGMMLLLCGQVIRPSYDWLTRQRPSRTWIEAQRILDPGGFERLAAHHDATRAGNQRAQRDALIRILWIILHKGGQVADITVGDCVELDRFVD